MTEKQKFLKRAEQMKAAGLVDFKLITTPSIREASEEEVYAELNRMFDAPDLPDPEVLGSYSP